MNPGRASTRRFWIYGLVLAFGVVVLFVWFIPQVSKATQRAPVHMEVGFSPQCDDSTVEPPDYGNREPVRYCPDVG
jgi:hypothetical protein